MKRKAQIISVISAFLAVILLLPAFRAAAEAPSGAGSAQDAYEVLYSAMRERSGGSIPDHFGGSWIGEDGVLHVNFKDIPADELSFYKELLAPFGGLVAFGTAKFSENELKETLEGVVSELLRAGVSYNTCDVDAESNAIRIAVPQDQFTTAAKILPQLDCFKDEPELAMFLFVGSLPASGSEGGARIVPAAAKSGGFPILAVLFGAAGVAVFFLRRRAQRRRIMRMGY